MGTQRWWQPLVPAAAEESERPMEALEQQQSQGKKGQILWGDAFKKRTLKTGKMAEQSHVQGRE